MLFRSEALSPWQPFHVDQGFRREDSTVTIGVTNNFGPAPAPYDTPDKAGAQTALELLCKEITHSTRLFNFPGRGPKSEEVMITLLISPSVAKSLADAGYTKQSLRQAIYENCTMRLADFEWVFKYTTVTRMTLKQRVDAVARGRQARAQRVALLRERLDLRAEQGVGALQFLVAHEQAIHMLDELLDLLGAGRDRKSTRLNSSHT